MFQHPKCSKMVPLWYENHILALPKPSKIVPKSMPKRLQNRLRLGCPLGAPKNTIFDVQTSPRWLPKISDFFQKSFKNSSYDGLWSKMPLGSLQEPAKSLPRASQEPSQSPQEALHSLQEPAIRIPRGLQEPALQTFLHSLTEDKTSKTKDPCRHGGGPTHLFTNYFIEIRTPQAGQSRLRLRSPSFC